MEYFQMFKDVEAWILHNLFQKIENYFPMHFMKLVLPNIKAR